MNNLEIVFLKEAQYTVATHNVDEHQRNRDTNSEEFQKTNTELVRIEASTWDNYIEACEAANVCVVQRCYETKIATVEATCHKHWGNR